MNEKTKDLKTSLSSNKSMEEQNKISVSDLKKKYDENPPKKTHKFKKTNLWIWYFAPGITAFTLLVSYVFIFVASSGNQKLGTWAFLGILLFMILSIPLMFFSVITLIIRILFFDRKKILKQLTYITTKNYIIANFLCNNKVVEVQPYPINRDGVTFSVGERLYIVDKDVIWRDEKNRPNSFYIPELPNPLDFNISKNLNNYTKLMENAQDDTDLNFISIDNDIAFSSTNLQTFKKNKIFTELTTQDDVVSTKHMNTIVVFAGVIILVLLIALIISVVVK